MPTNSYKKNLMHELLFKKQDKHPVEPLVAPVGMAVLGEIST